MSKLFFSALLFVLIGAICCAPIIDPVAILPSNVRWPFPKGLYSCTPAVVPPCASCSAVATIAGNCVYDTVFAAANGYPAIDPISTLGITRRKVKIGIAASYGGAQANTGNFAHIVINMWLEYYTTYSTMMFQGWDVEFGYKDYQATVVLARNATTTLVDWGANIILGAASTLCIESSRITEVAKIPMIGYTCGVQANYVCIDGTAANAPCTAANERRFKYSFGLHHPTNNYMIPAVQLFNIKRAKSIAILYMDVAPFLPAGLAAIAQAQALEMNIVYTAKVPIAYVTANSDRLKDYVNDLIRIQPDVAIICYNCVLFMKYMKELNYLPKAVAFTSCVDEAGSIASLGDDLRYLIGPSQWDHRLAGPDWIATARSTSTIYRNDWNYTGTHPSPVQFRQHYIRTAPANSPAPGYFEASLLAGITTAEAAIINANATDPTSLSSALSSMYEQSFWGITAFNRWGMDSYKPLVTLQIDESKQRQVITPFEFASKDFIYP